MGDPMSPISGRAMLQSARHLMALGKQEEAVKAARAALLALVGHEDVEDVRARAAAAGIVGHHLLGGGETDPEIVDWTARLCSGALAELDQRGLRGAAPLHCILAIAYSQQGRQAAADEHLALAEEAADSVEDRTNVWTARMGVHTRRGQRAAALAALQEGRAVLESIATRAQLDSFNEAARILGVIDDEA